MKLIEGFELVELTEDRIAQETRFGETGVIRMIGNPNPSEEERQKAIDEVAKILYQGYLRSLEEQAERNERSP